MPEMPRLPKSLPDVAKMQSFGQVRYASLNEDGRSLPESGLAE